MFPYPPIPHPTPLLHCFFVCFFFFLLLRFHPQIYPYFKKKYLFVECYPIFPLHFDAVIWWCCVTVNIRGFFFVII